MRLETKAGLATAGVIVAGALVGLLIGCTMVHVVLDSDGGSEQHGTKLDREIDVESTKKTTMPDIKK